MVEKRQDEKGGRTVVQYAADVRDQFMRLMETVRPGTTDQITRTLFDIQTRARIDDLRGALTARDRLTLVLYAQKLLGIHQSNDGDKVTSGEL